MEFLVLCLQPRWRDGRYPPGDGPDDGLAAARLIAMCSYRSHESLESRFARTRAADDGPFAVEEWLRHHGRSLVDRFDAASYVTLTRAMDTHDVGRRRGDTREALASVRVPTLVVSIDSDVLYPPVEQEALAQGIPTAQLARLRSPHGHDAFLIEGEATNAIVKQFGDQVERRAWKKGEPWVA